MTGPETAESNFFDRGGRKMPKYIFTHAEDGTVTAVKTPEWQKFIDSKRTNILFKKSGLPISKYLSLSQYKGEDTSRNIPKLVQYAKEFDSKFRNVHLYLWSELNSTQKTTSIVTVGKELLEQGQTVQFILMDSLLKSLTQETFKDQENPILGRCRTVDFLIIDDSFDPKKVTVYKSGYQLSFLDSFLRERLEVRGMATAFTSNIPIDKIGDTFGRSIMELIRRNVPCPMEFKDSISRIDVNDLFDN